jgi:predicted small metal-binding protein
MAKEDYKEFSCSSIGTECGFQIRAKTEAEIMEYAKMHASKAHGFKEIWPETEKKIKENIKTVSVDVPKKAGDSILTTRQDFKFK